MSGQPDSSAWLKKAESDQRAAGYLLEMEDDCPFDTVCFLAQQCAEKLLKAILVQREVDFPKTHDLLLLRGLIAETDRRGISQDDLGLLNRYAVITRYPGHWDPTSRYDAEKAVRCARGLLDSVKELLAGP